MTGTVMCAAETCAEQMAEENPPRRRRGRRADAGGLALGLLFPRVGRGDPRNPLLGAGGHQHFHAGGTCKTAFLLNLL